MKFILVLLLISSLTLATQGNAQVIPVIEWENCYGGSGGEIVSSIATSANGGLIVAGASGSIDGDITSTHGGGDAWVIALNTTGTKVWQKTYGGTNSDGAYCIQNTGDGYIIAGQTRSNDGDVSGNHGGFGDMWVLKIDRNGNIQWQKCLGGSGSDFGSFIEKTSDKGYIVAGGTNSNDGDVSFYHGGSNDIWIVKLDSVGNIMWQKTYGCSLDEVAKSVHQTTDGGYIVAGNTKSTDGDVSGLHIGSLSNNDIWVLKLNDTGYIEWQRCLGGTKNELGNCAIQTIDGGYIITGNVGSNDGDVSGRLDTNAADGWVIKLSTSGTIDWQKCYGGTQGDYFGSIYATNDGGYIVEGATESNDKDVSGFHGGKDCWVVKLKPNGNLQWQKCLGGSYTDDIGGANAIIQTADGGYAAAIFTQSNDGDVTGYHDTAYSPQGGDYWVVKLDKDPPLGTANTASPLVQVMLSPNPFTNTITINDAKGCGAVLADIFGRTIVATRIATTKQTIPIPDIPTGVYYLRLYDAAKQTQVFKLVKE